MREMKDSGVAWIGEIPTNWNVVRIKNLIATRDGGAWGDEANGKDGDMICLRIADFNYPQYRFDDEACLTIRHYKKDIINRLTLKKGDILIEKSGGGEKTPVGRAVIFDKEYPALYANFMDRLRCKSTINPYWVLYNFANLYANNYTKPYIKQTTGIQNLDLQALMNSECFAMPPHKLQNIILEELEKDSRKVDTLIANNEAQIEKLKQYKQSLITEVVTKGLDPTVPMKDSGVEWIGEIPEHWGLNRIKYICKFNPSNKCNMDSTLNVSYAPMECVKNGYMLCKEITIDKISSGLTYFEEEDIVMAKVTPCFENGNIAIAENLKNGVGFGSSELFVFRCLQVYNRWLMYFLRSSTFIERAKATMTGTGGLKRVSPNFVNSLTLAIPPKTEQEQISTYLDTKCAQIDSLIAIKQAKIEKLNQYKKSLIYEYVTGKKEVVQTNV